METFNLKGNQTMKTTFRLIGAVATAAALFSSCKKEAFNEEVKPGTVEMTIIAGADDATRTVLGSDGAVTWSATGETLKVLENNGASNLSSYTSEEGVSNDERKTMSFAVSLDSKIAETFDYFALYPSTSFVEDTYSDAKRVKVILPAQQSPSATSFDPTSDILVSKPVLGLAKQPTSLELQFARVVAIGKMNITKLNTEEKVKKVSFTATGKVVNGRSYINLEDASAVQYGYYAKSATVTLDYTEQSIAANGMIAYFTCWPFELAVGETFSVVVETENYIFTKDVTLEAGQSLAFNVGSASAFSVSFSGIEGVEKVPSTQLVEDGAYVVAQGENMMTVGTSSNKYRDVATLPTANKDGSYSVDATAAWNFVYDSATDSYKIYSASDATKYIQGSSSGSDFKLVAQGSATSFTITKGENGTYKISNGEYNIGMNIDTNPYRFAMYKGSIKQPVDLNLYPAKVAILPKITVQETLSVPSAETKASFSVTLTNVADADVTVYKDEACTEEETEWITAAFNADQTAIEYVVKNNTGAARTAYIKIHAHGPETSEATAIVTVTQAGGSAGGETVTLFSESFGDNSNSARAWSDSYKEQGGISSVYSGSTYTITNAKQSKNTVGKTKSGLAQSTQNKDAIFEIKSLNVAAYSDLSVSYYWKAGSISKTYSTSLYYSKDGGTTYTEVNKTQGTGATTFVEVKYTLPADAVSSNLCLKVVFNTSNTQAVIDDFVLKGKK